MSKQKTKFIVTILLILILIGYYYPHQLDKLLVSSDRIIITKTEPSFVDGRPKLESFEYEILSHTDEYDMFVDIFSKYSYHMDLTAFLKGNEIKGAMNIYSIYIYKDNKLINFLSNQENNILINGYSYSMGFLGKSKQIALINDIELLLVSINPY